MVCGHIGIALVVVHAIFWIRKESVFFGTIKFSFIPAVVIAIPSVAVSIPTADIGWKIAPFMCDIKQIVLLAGHVCQASIIALPIS